MEQERVEVWERYELMKRQFEKAKRALALHEINNHHKQPAQQSQGQGPKPAQVDQQVEEQAPPPIAPPPQKVGKVGMRMVKPPESDEWP